jgi:hypothetical protein
MLKALLLGLQAFLFPTYLQKPLFFHLTIANFTQLAENSSVIWYTVPYWIAMLYRNLNRKVVVVFTHCLDENRKV